MKHFEYGTLMRTSIWTHSTSNVAWCFKENQNEKFSIGEDNYINVLNVIGNQGWQLVHILSLNFDIKDVRMIMMREKQ